MTAQITGTVVGSAIAFRLFLFFVPLLLFLVGVAGFVSHVVDADDVNEDAGLTGSLAAQIDTALSQPTQTRWVAVLVGLFGVATAGYSLSKVMVASSALGWQLPDRPKASPKVVGAFVGLIAGVGLVAMVINRIRAELGLGVASVSFLAAFVFYVVAWLIVSMVLPQGDERSGRVAAGGGDRRLDVDRHAGGQPAAHPRSAEPGVGAVRHVRGDDRDARLVLHPRSGHRARHRLQRRDPRALREHRQLRVLLAADPRAAQVQAGARVFGLEEW